MENEVPHTYYQENKTGSDSSSLRQFSKGNLTQEILSHQRILAEKVKKVKKQMLFLDSKGKNVLKCLFFEGNPFRHLKKIDPI